MKKILALLLTIAIILVSFPLSFTTFAATSGVTGDCTWELDGTTLTISGKGAIGDYNTNGGPWGKAITRVIIEDGVTRIGKYAFYGCASLTSVQIPGSVRCIANYAFKNCTSLSAVSIPYGVNVLSYECFSGCTALTSVSLPTSLKNISAYVFADCKNLSSIYLPSSITKLDGGVFKNCTKLTSITLPSEITSIVTSLFEGCTALRSVSMGDKITEVGGKAFYNCSALTELILPDSCQKVENGALTGCTSLRTLATPFYASGTENSHLGRLFGASNNELNKQNYVPRTLTKLIVLPAHEGRYIDLSACYYITDLVVKEGVTTLPTFCFSACNAIARVSLPDSLRNYKSTAFDVTAYGKASGNWSGGVLYIGKHLFKAKNTVTGAFTVREGTLSIGSGAFDDATGITKVTLPASVQKVGDAFAKCDKITEFVIPDEVRGLSATGFEKSVYYNTEENYVNDELYIGNHLIRARKCESGFYAFKEGTVTIASSAFRDVRKSSSIYLPKSVKSATSLTSFPNLTNVWYGGSEEEKNLYFDNYNDEDYIWHFNTCKVNEHQYTNDCDTVCNNCEWERTVTHNYTGEVCADCEFVKGITFEEIDGEIKIKQINTKYTECLVIPEYINNLPVTIIGESVFKDKSIAEKIVLPNTVRVIEKEAFSGCRTREINIPQNLEVIGDNAFYLNGFKGDLVIPNSVKTIGDYAFSDCYEVQSVKIGNGVESIGKYAFKDTSITEIVIPDSVKTIGESAFEWVETLEKVTFLSAPESIGIGAFSGCSALKEVHAKDVKSWCETDFADLSANPLYYTKTLYINGEKVTEIHIPEDTKKVSKFAFYGCKDIAEITIADAPMTIGTQAFYGTAFYDNSANWQDKILYINNHLIKTSGANMDSYSVKEGTLDIAAEAFYYCSIKEIVLPQSVKEISENAFMNASITQITLPDDITTIRNGTFYLCTSLKKVTLSEGLKEIGMQAFYGCQILPEIKLPETLETVGGLAFGNCRALKEIVIPNSVKTVGGEAFYMCLNLERAVFCEGLEYLGDSVFSRCDKITDVYLPKSVKVVGKGDTANNGTLLYTLWYGGTAEDKEKITDTAGKPFTGSWHYTKTSCFMVCEDDGIAKDMGHAYYYYDGKTPNCEEFGWADYKRCLACGLTDYREIDALGHLITPPVMKEENGEIYTEFCCENCDVVVKNFDGKDWQKGDINGDGNVDVVDLALLKKIVAGLITLTTEVPITVDIDESMVIDVVDLAVLKKLVAGI